MDFLYISEYSNRKRYIKIYILIAIITIIVIAGSTLIAINIVNNAKTLEMEIPEEKSDNVELLVVQTNEIILPKYTEQSKENMANIYNSTDKVAYLTFDDGPSSSVTPRILDTLKEQNVKATFFVLGARTDLYPNIVKRAYEEGHYIANHGYTHEYKTIYANSYAVLDEYNKTENSIKEALGISEYNSHLFRFPGGSNGGTYKKIKQEAISILNENNIAYIDWNSLTNDSAYSDPQPDVLMQKLKGTTVGKNAVVILMHDTGTKQVTADILPDVIAYLREEGYEFRNFYDVMK